MNLIYKTLCSAALLAVVPPVLAGNFQANFNDGQTPAGATLFGNTGDNNAGVIELTGGVDNSGCLKLTKAVNSAQGSMIIDDLDAGAAVNSFTATFKVRIGGGTSTPADGMSFCFGSDVNGAFGEAGTGSGLRVGIDIYNNPDNAPAFKISWGGVQVATTGILPIASIVTGANFVDVLVRINPSGTLDVVYNGTPLMTNLNIGFQPVIGGRFGFGARTGGATANHFVDDISITTSLGDFLAPAVVVPPRSVRMVNGYTTTLRVTANDPANTTYQWERKLPGAPGFTPVAGENADTLTTATLGLADSGTEYRVILTNPASVAVTSVPAVIEVVSLPQGTPNTVSYNFDDGNTPAGTNNYGTAVALLNGGFGDSGFMRLTESLGGQAGTWTVDDLNSGLPVESIDIAFRLLMTPDPGAVPADGFGFHWAPNLPESGFPNAEEPVGSGLSVGFDVYNNGANEAPAVDVFWLGTRIGGSALPVAVLNTEGAFVDVQIRLSSLGRVDVAFNGEVVAWQVQIPAWTAFSGAKYGFAARTGGAFQQHAIDDVRIKSVPYSGPIGLISHPANATALVGRTATFSATSNDPTRTSYQWQISVGGAAFTNITGAESQTYTTPVLAVGDNGNQYRVRLTSTGNASTADSNPALLTVVDLVAPLTGPIVNRFNNLTDVDNQGTAPAAVQTLSGNYTFEGDASNGYLVLTQAANSQFGTLVVDDLNGNAAVGGFTASVKTQLVGENPADGWSFSWGTGIAPVQVYGGLEAGLGNDLRISFITYGPSGVSIRVNFRGVALANIPVPLDLLQSAPGTFEEVLIRVTPATSTTSALLDVAQDGQLVIRNLALPGLQGIAGGRFAIAARTGGANELHAYDDLVITTIPYVGPITLVSAPPVAQTILENSAVTLTVESSNPAVTTYQWQRAPAGSDVFANIPGATELSYTTPLLALPESGVKFQVVSTGSTNAVTTAPSVITVVTPGLPATWDRIIDFDDGNAPGDALLLGTAGVFLSGGVGDTGALVLTTAVNGLQGSMALGDQDGGEPVRGFVTNFQLRIGNGSNPPADGASFVWAPSAITAPFGESGAGIGLIVSFDIYDNEDGNPDNEAGEAPAIEAMWKGESLGNVRVPRSLLESGSEFRNVIVRVNPEGTLDVIFGSRVLFWKTPLPGFAPVSGGNFGWGGRTGGLNAEQAVDNIFLTTFVGDAPSIQVVQAGGNVVITFDGVLEFSDTLNAWTPMPGQASPLILPLNSLSGHRYYRSRK